MREMSLLMAVVMTSAALAAMQMGMSRRILVLVKRSPIMRSRVAILLKRRADEEDISFLRW